MFRQQPGYRHPSPNRSCNEAPTTPAAPSYIATQPSQQRPDPTQETKNDTRCTGDSLIRAPGRRSSPLPGERSGRGTGGRRGWGGRASARGGCSSSGRRRAPPPCGRSGVEGARREWRRGESGGGFPCRAERRRWCRLVRWIRRWRRTAIGGRRAEVDNATDKPSPHFDTSRQGIFLMEMLII